MTEHIDQNTKNKFRIRYVFYLVILLLFLLSLLSHQASDLAILEGGAVGKVISLLSIVRVILG